MRQYLQLLRDFRDAIKAGDWRKAWSIAIEIQKAVLDLFGAPAVTMSAEEKAENAALTAEIGALLDSAAVPADVDANKIGDGKKIIAILIPIFRALLPILIGL